MAYNLHTDQLIYTLFDSFIEFSGLSNSREKTALEVGAGVGIKSIPLAELFLKYVVIEPDIVLFNTLQSNCIKFDSKIEALNVKLANYKTHAKYDVVILNNVFHLIFEDTLHDKLLQLVTIDGLIYIQQPLPYPKGWGDDRLNKGSGVFDSKLWVKMRDKLNVAHEFLISKGFNLTKTERYHIYTKQG
jgi:2-polyprenyl-3-methyl-5-hydroxy-6-metoxy-1,4-benzoquinol methylase